MKIKIALMTFSDPRYIKNPETREKFIKESHDKLKNLLISSGFEIVDPHLEIKKRFKYNFGMDSSESVKEACNYIRINNSDILILECYHWSEPQFANLAVKYANIPTIIFAKEDATWAGTIYFGAVCATLSEVPVNIYAKLHGRVFDNVDLLLRYINAFGTYSQLRKSAVILFGGSYSLNMPHLRDDMEYLKSFLLEEIYEEEQYLIVRKAQEILKNDNDRVNKFYKWLIDNGTRIEFDNFMLSEKILKTQIALYLGVKDRIKEYPNNVIGISIKCQPVLSEDFGVTGCMIPTFLPFPEDFEGKQKIISTTCEGDIKGLITGCMLNLLRKGEIPPLFGDLKAINDNYIIISNCGGSSLYYASNSNDSKKALSNLSIGPQCQGKSGGAFGYIGKSTTDNTVTVSRLLRKERKYFIQTFSGSLLDITEEMLKKVGFGKNWPHVAISTNKSAQFFAENIVSNHYSMIPGDYLFEINKICELFGIEILKF